MSRTAQPTNFTAFDPRLLQDCGLAREDGAIMVAVGDPRLVRIERKSWLDRLAALVRPQQVVANA